MSAARELGPTLVAAVLAVGSVFAIAYGPGWLAVIGVVLIAVVSIWGALGAY